MGLKRLPYEGVAPLIREYLSKEEWEDTADIIRQLRPARDRGYLTPSELEVICRWKSPRALQYIKSNSAFRVRTATRKALVTRSERDRLEALTELRGVSLPMASAILTLLNPRRYGVIDIRVWQLLHAAGAVTKKPGGVGFNFKNWYQFLMIIRYFARTLGVKARDIERTLFVAHKEYQKGTLYRTSGGRLSNWASHPTAQSRS
jgi:hypothetical protein